MPPYHVNFNFLEISFWKVLLAVLATRSGGDSIVVLCDVTGKHLGLIFPSPSFVGGRRGSSWELLSGIFRGWVAFQDMLVVRCPESVGNSGGGCGARFVSLAVQHLLETF